MAYDSTLNQHGWRRKEKPGSTRRDCHYTQEFIVRPLDNVAGDREMAELHAEAAKGAGLSSGLPLDPSTTHRGSYQAYGRDCRSESCRPERELHVSRSNKLYEKESAAAREFPAHDRNLANRYRGELIEPFNGTMRASEVAMESRTAHRRDFNAAKLDFQPRSKFP